MKKCSYCKEDKDISLFTIIKKKKKLDIGCYIHYRSMCKSCENEENRFRYSNNINGTKEKRKASSSKYFKAHKETVYQRKRRWEKNNPDKHKAITKRNNSKWNKNHPDITRISSLKYRNNNIEKAREANRIYQNINRSNNVNRERNNRQILADVYVKTVICAHSGIKHKHVSEQLIQSTRAYIYLLRIINKQKHETNKSKSINTSTL